MPVYAGPANAAKLRKEQKQREAQAKARQARALAHASRKGTRK
ncbi:hypothetical protein [Mesorhizobium sp. M0847]